MVLTKRTEERTQADTCGCMTDSTADQREKEGLFNHRCWFKTKHANHEKFDIADYNKIKKVCSLTRSERN